MARISACILLLGLFASPAVAQEATELQPATETSRFIFTSLLALAAGAGLILLLAGFAAREAGVVRAKNAGASAVKAVALVAVSSLAAWLVGYNLIFSVEAGGFLGDFSVWAPNEEGASAISDAARFLYVALGGAAGAAILAGAVAERIRFWPFLVFTAAYASLVFPIAASWTWGGGYLAAAWKFVDFGGASLVHACGGWAALAGAVIVGPRLARYDGEEPRVQPPSNPGLAAVGGLLIWLGLFAFMAGALPSLSAAADAMALARIFVNAQLAAAAGVVAAIALTEIIYKRPDLNTLINGAIGGLVAISAGPAEPALWQAAIIGAFSGAIVTVTRPLFDRFRIDDAAGVLPAHLLCGIWGALIVPWSNENATYLGQAAGVVVTAAFSLTMSILIWTLLRYTVGLRVSPERELAGLDLRGEAAPKPKM
ncbi:MAG: ammonium transporter [Parvularculaceae bacterium]|nr:ammonium transporter [Parvularculaceae bacterium]